MLGVLRGLLPGAAFAQTWPTLISLWQFDETSPAGGVFVDVGPANVPMNIVGTWADLSTDSMIQGIGGTSAYTGGSGYATIPANDPDHDLAELTISFYYQRNSAAAKHVLLAASDALSTGIGDFSIEVLANGKLRCFHVGQDAQLRFFESTNGITGTNLEVGTAHRIDLTLGSLGARIYLDGAPLTDAFIQANTNGWNNARVKFIGTWIDGAEAPADGAFDGFRLWNKQLTDGQIAALEPAQSIELPGVGAVDLGTLAAFTRSTINVTGLAGWPAGRTPKAVLAQGARASAYIRRAWKPSLNSGTHIDIIPGWQKTTGQEFVSLQLDDNSEIEIAYTVGHAIPAPTGSGVTRTLDRSASPGGLVYNTWASAIAVLTSGDVLVVRAPAGTWTDSGGHAIPNYVYDVTTNVAPPAGVSNVTVVAHPDDVAAGRRPVIWRNAGRYARYKYAAASAWQVHASLGGGLTVYESVVTHPAPQISLFGAFRDQVGDWMVMYNHQTMTDATDRSGVLHDTTYPGYSGVNNTTYMGPTAIHNRVTNRIEIRLDAPKEQTYSNPGGSAPFPPWDWTRHYPPSTNPASVECIFTDGGDGSNINYLLDLTSRNGWKFYNIDFIYGSSAINGTSQTTPPQFFACNFVGGAPVSFYNTGGDAGFTISAVGVRINSSGPHGSDMLFDRCNLQGGYPPWAAWTEGKGNEGAFGIPVRRAMTSGLGGRFMYRNCNIVNFFHLVWDSAPTKCHWHHCYLRQFGTDGALIVPANSTDYMVNRCFIPSGQVMGFSSSGGAGILYHFSFNVDLRLTALVCTRPNFGKWANTGNRASVTPALVGSVALHHGGHSQYTERRYFNTHVGSQNTERAEMSSGGQGVGAGIGPDTRRGGNRVYNSIGAVYPPPIAWQGGVSSFVGMYTTRDGGNEYDHNLLFKHAGMLPPGTGLNTFMVVTDAQPSPSFVSHGSLASLQGAGFEANGTQADPQFAVTPAWATSDPYAAGGAFDMANYMLGPSSPARTGARNLNDQSFPDYDFEELTPWAGGTNAPYRGALDPNAPAIEQEVGIVGPAPPEIG